MSVQTGEMDCRPKCRSKQHAAQLIIAITKGSSSQLRIFLSRCHKVGRSSDSLGRTPLMMAASVGKWEIVEWLITEKGAELSSRDQESGWTALHRALFYGQINTARHIIALGGSVTTLRDREGLTPLDIVMKDRLPYIEYKPCAGPQDVWTWGDNTNFTLGHDKEQRRKMPETVDVFRRSKISVTQVVMCKFHTVFLTHTGAVFTCGHGRGGRLGHGNETTILDPRRVCAGEMDKEVCVQIDAAHDHTVMLMESGAIYSCGLNEHHQLGQFPIPQNSLVPKQMNSKVLKGRKFVGILANRFHTTLYTTDAVFTFGLNAGQLGHHKVASEPLVSHPRQVAALNQRGVTIRAAAASEAATVVVTTAGDVFVLHEYQCRKIANKWLDVEQVCVAGGHLDHGISVATRDVLRERGGSELIIVLLNSAGKAYVWRGSEPTLKRCVWSSVRRPLHITQVTINISHVAFVTTDGEAFRAPIPKPKTRDAAGTDAARNTDLSAAATVVIASSPPPDMFTQSLADLVTRRDDQVKDFVKVERIPAIHRAVAIATDIKGQNYAALQASPNNGMTMCPTVETSEMIANFACLFEEADTLDLIHDVILQVGNEEIPAHQFILACRSDFFRQLFIDKSPDMINDKPTVVVIENVTDTQLFHELLKFIYTDSCDLLNVGEIFTWRKAMLNENGELTLIKCSAKGSKELSRTSRERDDNEYLISDQVKKSAAFEVYSKQKKEKMDVEQEGKKEKSVANNPVKELQDLAKKFGVKSLIKRLDAVKWSDGKIKAVHGKQLGVPRLKFDQTKYPILYDVRISTEDGETIQAHKCVLVARLEYFHSMLASGWIETSNAQSLTLPIPGNILSVVIKYLYSDDSSIIADCENAEFLCNTLVVADQLLIGRLKDLCQVAIVNLLSVKNVCELLEFASVYHAEQLKEACQQFAVINLPTLIESRSLDLLSDDVADDLALYYKRLVPGMDRRILTPYDGWPTHADLESLEAADTTASVSQTPLKKNRQKKRRLRTKSSNDEDVVNDTMVRRSSERQVSVCSDVSELEEPHSSYHQRQISVCSDVSDVSAADEQVTQQHQDLSNKIHIHIPQSLPVNVGRGPADKVLNSAPSPAAVVREQPSSPREAVQVSKPDVSLSGGTALSLRDIMAQEKQAVISSKQGQQHTANTAASKKPGGKLSQKERKRLQLQQQEVLQPVPAATAKCPWALPIAAPVTAVNAGVVQSFKDLVLSEEVAQKKAKVPAMAAKSAESMRLPEGKVAKAGSGKILQRQSPAAVTGGSGDTVIRSWGLPTSVSAKRAARSSLSPHTAPFVPAATNPWGSTSNPTAATTPSPTAEVPALGASSPRPLHPSHSLSQIMAAEQQEKASLQRATNKPLALIQIEEEAIHQLRQLYNVSTETECIVSIERVTTKLASPTWAAMQQHPN